MNLKEKSMNFPELNNFSNSINKKNLLKLIKSEEYNNNFKRD